MTAKSVAKQEKTIDEMIGEIQDKYNIVGRERELRKCLAAKLAERHILLEGDVGVGKTTLAHAIASYFSQNIERVDGDERYSSSKLVGHFDPPMVIEKGYSWESFVTGALTKAMQDGAILFLNELNRMPEGTQNVLLAAMDEGTIILPKLGEVKAKDGFFIISAMNPAELVATTPLSEALRDRFVWVRLNYQSEEEEENIVRVKTGIKDDKIVKIAVKIVRKTRDWPDLRRGSSIRGAIDLASIIRFLDPNDIDSWIDSSIMALATKIELEDGVESQVEEVIKEIVNKVFEEEDFF
ncbi:MAG: AAA family ATPase [Candidatus Heimdallarchaeaceae archaeon]